MKLFTIALDEEIDKQTLIENQWSYNNDLKILFHPETNSGLLFTGVGKITSCFNLTNTINKLKEFNIKIDRIINIGTAGAVNDSYKVFDLCLIKSTQFLDVDLTAFNYELNQLRLFNKIIKLDTTIISNNIKFNHQATVGTSDSFINSCNLNKFIEVNNVDLIDMELSSISYVADQFDIPINSFKIVSDLVKNSIGSNQYSSNLNKLQKQVSNIIIELSKQV